MPTDVFGVRDMDPVDDRLRDLLAQVQQHIQHALDGTHEMRVECSRALLRGIAPSISGPTWASGLPIPAFAIARRGFRRADEWAGMN